jgi:sec-independent protein translocase protein TatA
MGELKPWHIIIILVVFVALFGAKKLPESARSIGKSLRIFKDEIKDHSSDKPKSDDSGNSESK